MEEQIKNIIKKLDMLCSAILGDPTNPDHPGLNLRIDRLEQREKFKNKLMWLVSLAAFTALGQAIFFNLL